MASKGLQSFTRSLSVLRAFNSRSRDPLVVRCGVGNLLSFFLTLHLAMSYTGTLEVNGNRGAFAFASHSRV
jgi:hypothetical protein